MFTVKLSHGAFEEHFVLLTRAAAAVFTEKIDFNTEIWPISIERVG